MEPIDITGINRYELLAALCNGTKSLGMGKFASKADCKITANDVLSCIDEQGDMDSCMMDFDYLFGRPIKISIVAKDGKLFLDRWWLYDRDSGKGSAERIVDSIRGDTDRVNQK